MQSTDTLDDAVFQRFHQLEHRLAQEEPFEQLIAAYDAIVDEFVPRYESLGEPDKALATRRSVAASIVLVAMTANRPSAECDGYFRRMVDLGFHDFGRKAHEIIVFGGHVARHGGDVEMIRGYLEALRADLAAEPRASDSTWNDYRTRCDEILARLTGSQY